MTLQVTASTDPAYIEANAQPCVFYRNLLAEGTVASAGLPTATPRLNAYSGDTDTFWQPATVPETLRATFGGAQPADGAFFAAHTLGTAGATLTVQYFDGAIWQTQASYAPPDNLPFGFIWPARSATGWGIQISGAVAQIGVSWIGPRLVIPGGVKPDYEPIWAAAEIVKAAGTTRRGHFQGQAIERTGARLNPSFMDVPFTFARDDLAAFRTHYNEGNPFVWASAPSIFPTDAAYCWATEGARLGAPIRAGGYWTGLDMSMEAYVERTP